MRELDTIPGVHFSVPDDLLRQPQIGMAHAPPRWIKVWKRAFLPGDTVIDLGANVGLMSLRFALLGAKVEAFEPSPRNRERLHQVCGPFRQIRIHELGVSRENKTYLTPIQDCAGRENPSFPIRYVIYDEFAKAMNFADPRLVKMDIEGMEAFALLGMTDVLERIRPIWQMEYHPHLHYDWPGFPGFVPVEKGGFDFRKFEDLEYVVFNKRFKLIKFGRFLATGVPDVYFMVPRERLSEFEIPLY